MYKEGASFFYKWLALEGSEIVLYKNQTKLVPSKSIIFSAAFGLFFVYTQAQDNFEEIFGNNYEKAISFIEQEKAIPKKIESYGLPTKEVVAVIFPELIRYNSIQDKMETFALESLYVKYATDYANFSIGVFQMKPSFAEQIEKDYLKTERPFQLHLI